MEGGSLLHVLSAGLFDTNGTLELAENSGGGATTFDGISFDAALIDYGSQFNGFGAGAPGPEINRTGTYITSVSGTTLSGLTSGQQYRVQALIYDGRGNHTGRTVTFDGVDMGVYANGVSGVSWGPGLLVTGTFTADAATQDFTIETFEPSGGSAGNQLNAITLYSVVPEPSSAALLGLGGLALILRRRK